MIDPKVRIDDVVDPRMLKALWRRPIRRKLRAMRLAEFVLAHDALEWAWTEQQLDELVSQLGARVESGAYRPDPVELVRAAKAVGLTRPLAFLSIRDGLLYRSIVARAERRLLSGFPRWARFGRGDVEDDDPSTSTESGWFRAWLARQNHHWVMTGLYDWLVETDIANFFPYVDAAAVVRHTLAQGNLAEETARLLEFMLRSFSPMRNFRTLQIAGLPQEPLDSSRILAHAYLRELDEAFRAEGTDERYTRWMDDVLIGAYTREEALQQVRRVQEALEPLGLYPNTAKTRITSSASFVTDYLKDENDYLGDVDDELKANRPVDLDIFLRRLRRHLRSKRRGKAWGRVLRRYYSLSRALEHKYLTGRWTDDIRDSPDSAAHVLEYMATFRLSEARFTEMRAMLKDFGGVYEDVELLCMEYLATAPINNDIYLRNLLASWALDIADAAKATKPRLAAAALVVVGKHADEPVITDLQRLFWRRFRSDSIVRQQAIPVLLGLGRLDRDDLLLLDAGSGADSSGQLRFLQQLAAGSRPAAGAVRGIAQPSQRKRPNRSVIRPRALFLLPHLETSFGHGWLRTRNIWLRDLKGNAPRLRDRSAERWLTM